MDPQRTADYYCRRFASLRVDRSTGSPAPHKPILLLAVIELFEQGKVLENKLRLTPDLLAAFLRYWDVVAPCSHRPHISLPFYHLKGDGFWHLQPRREFLKLPFTGLKLRTVAAINQTIEYAYLDRELYEFMLEHANRVLFARVLWQSWFGYRGDDVSNLIGTDSFAELQQRELLSGGEVLTEEQARADDEVVLRNAAFREVVTTVYGRTCAVCRLAVQCSQNGTIVDAAHIVPFYESRDNRIVNGVCLCKNHHWAFDKGWFCIDESFGINVSSELRETGSSVTFLDAFRVKCILLPRERRYWPDPVAFAWHRQHRFQSSGA